MILRFMNSIKIISDGGVHNQITYKTEKEKSEVTIKMLFKIMEIKHSYKKSN